MSFDCVATSDSLWPPRSNGKRTGPKTGHYEKEERKARARYHDMSCPYRSNEVDIIIIDSVAE